MLESTVAIASGTSRRRRSGQWGLQPQHRLLELLPTHCGAPGREAAGRGGEWSEAFAESELLCCAAANIACSGSIRHLRRHLCCPRNLYARRKSNIPAAVTVRKGIVAGLKCRHTQGMKERRFEPESDCDKQTELCSFRAIMALAAPEGAGVSFQPRI